ncbi:MAG: IS21-like element helper ATPase IstB [Deltaproteobacteria bacterium]|nr:IS21-like element helper ATPase IstB [Deltaproteobacteria bacterium]MBW2667926.1 IS21-like element helper ATPase IstB [Deltaproteobacteria bacterium]
MTTHDFDVDAGLRRLHLPTVRRMYPQLQEQAEKEGWSYRDFLSQLISEELAHRAETRIQRATHKARFPFLKTIEEFDFTFQTSIKRKAIGRYLGPEIVSEGRSAILLGRPGRGKTHLAIAFAYKAIQNGFVARFVTLAEMLNDLHRATRDGDLDAAVEPFVDPDVLVLDELGYLTYGPDAANLLFQVVDRRYLAQRPVIVTSNKQPGEWGRVLHDPDLADAIVDRLLERGEVVQLRGKSYRNPDGDSIESNS